MDQDPKNSTSPNPSSNSEGGDVGGGGVGPESSETTGSGGFADESNIADGSPNPAGGDQGNEPGGETPSDAGPEKSEKSGGFKDKAKSKAGDMAERAKSKAGDMAAGASEKAQKVKKGIDDAKKVVDPKVSANKMAKDEMKDAEGIGGKADAAVRVGGAKAASAGAAAASGGLTKEIPGLDSAIQKGTMVVTRPENRKKVAFAVLAVLSIPIIIIGFIAAVIFYAAANPLKAIQAVLSGPKVEEFQNQSAELAPEAKIARIDELKKYGYVDYKPGTALAAPTLPQPKPGSLAEKMTKVNYKTAAYQTQSAPDCPITFTYKTVTNGQNSTEIVDKAFNKKGEEVKQEGFLYDYCLMRSMPIYNMMVRTQKARDTNKFSGSELNYADLKDGFKQRCGSVKEQNECAYKKSYERITSKAESRPTIDKEYKSLSSEDKKISDYIGDVSNALKPESKKDPNSINFPVKNPEKTDTIARTMCLFSDNYLTSKNIKKTIGYRLNTGQRSGIKSNTLSSTREVGDVSNEETAANFKQLDGWTSSTAYSQNLYGTLSGTDIDPESIGNSSYGANYSEVLSLLIALKTKCDKVDDADGFFNSFLDIFGGGTDVESAQKSVRNIYDALRKLIVVDSNGKFTDINDFGLEQLIISVVRISGGSAVSGVEPGVQNFNNQSQGFRAVSNQYMMQMGGRFLSKEESQKLSLATENTRIELEKKNGLAYRLFGKDNIRSIANIMQYETPKTPNEVKSKTKQYIAMISNPIKMIADTQSTIGYIATGSRSTTFAAGQTGDSYMKLNTVGVVKDDYKNIDVYAVSDEIQKMKESGTEDQKKALGYFDKCSKANIATENYFARGYPVDNSGKINKNSSFKIKEESLNLPKYPAAGEDDTDATKPNFQELGFENRTEMIACEIYLLPNRKETTKDLGDSIQKSLFGFNINDLARKYRVYLYSNSMADLMVELSSTEKTDKIYASSSTASSETTGGPGANTDIVTGDTSGLTCAAGTDGGVGDGYKDGKLIKIRLCNVQGIVVNSQISSNVDLLLNSAKSAGINLSGGGFRTMESQIATRRNNCGSSQYDIYEKPSDQCKPPTARPGNSNHQMGLAIDLSSDGKLILSSSNKGFIWLDANASKFGLINFKKEPWHWSTDGK